MSGAEVRSYVLVVDDDDDLRESVAELLRDEGYETATARDGAGARWSWFGRGRVPA
jgi:CheY-like chemotaxis protein